VSSDNELRSLYGVCRLVFKPLGVGVKLKILAIAVEVSADDQLFSLCDVCRLVLPIFKPLKGVAVKLLATDVKVTSLCSKELHIRDRRPVLFVVEPL
jgi:hypothetical protein